MAESPADDDVLSLAIFICQELGFQWAPELAGDLQPTQDDFIRVAAMVLDLQRSA